MNWSQVNTKIARFFKAAQSFNAEQWLNKSRFNEKRQLEFLAYFSSWLPSGAVAACNAIIDTGAGIKSRALEVMAARAIKSSLEEGAHISVGLKQMFSPSIVLLFQAAQESNKPNAMQHILQSYIDQETEISNRKSALIKSLIYPMVLIVFSLLINTGISTFLVQVAESIGTKEFGAMGNLTLALGRFMTDYVGLFALVVFVVVMGCMKLATDYVGIQRPILDVIFPFSVYKSFCVMRTLRILGLLIEYETSVRDALGVLAENSNKYVRHHLNLMFKNIAQSGISLHIAMNTGFLQAELLYRLKLQMEHNDHEVRTKAISHVADFAGLESAKTLGFISKLIVATAYIIGVVFLIAGFGGYLEAMSLIYSVNNSNI